MLGFLQKTVDAWSKLEYLSAVLAILNWLVLRVCDSRNSIDRPSQRLLGSRDLYRCVHSKLVWRGTRAQFLREPHRRQQLFTFLDSKVVYNPSSQEEMNPKSKFEKRL